MTFNPKRRKEDKYPGRVLGFFQKFFITIGVAMTFSIIMLSISIARLTSDNTPPLPDKILLTYVFDSSLTEVAAKPSLTQPLLRPAATLHEVTDALREAAKDSRVKGFVARIADISFSTAQVQEIRDAIIAFRKSGKFAYVFGESYGDFTSGMGDYYLATAFDKIWMQPVGAVSITGMVMQVPFLKGILDKVGVAPEFAHKGMYKSASESLTETTMSGPHREMMTSLLTDLSAQISNGIADGRGMTALEVARLIDGAPYSDKRALELKLVDRLGYADEVMAEAKEKVSGPDNEPVDLLTYDDDAQAREAKKSGSGFMTKLMKKSAPEKETSKEAAKDAKVKGHTIALIFGEGEVVSSSGKKSFGDGGLSTDKATAAFRAAQKDDDVAAIVFRIDSPGGSPTAAETIRRVLLQTKEKGKPVIVSMGSTAASGGYWIAAAADKIVAEPATLTGSIGVFGGKFVIKDLLDKLGIGIETLASGEDAAMWSATKNFTPEQKAKFEAQLGDIYDAFITRVAEGRHLTREQVEAIAQGRVYTGKQALDNHLVDMLGGLDVAIDEAKKIAKLEGDVPVVRFPPRKSTLELLISLATDGAALGPGYNVGIYDVLQALQANASLQQQSLKADLPLVH